VNVDRADVRDALVVALFGVCAPWLWFVLLAILTHIEAPILAALFSATKTQSKAFVSSYFLGLDLFSALVGAILIGLPLGYLLRSHPIRGWLQFVLAFWSALAFAALFSDGPFDLSYVAAYPSAWLFLAMSAFLIIVGHKLRRRHAEA
jgi:hypothetical protein